jgi:glucose-6-phosphate 1-dehydrogenase
VVRLDPSTGIRIVLDALRGEQPDAAEIDLDLQFAQVGAEGPTPYEVLLHAALVGDSSHFTRQDMVEETWRILQPLLASPPELHTYEPSTWGPAEGAKLAAGYGGWRGPWVAEQH